MSYILRSLCVCLCVCARMCISQYRCGCNLQTQKLIFEQTRSYLAKCVCNKVLMIKNFTYSHVLLQWDSQVRLLSLLLTHNVASTPVICIIHLVICNNLAYT